MARPKKDSVESEELQPTEGLESPVEAESKEPVTTPKTPTKSYSELYFEMLGKPIPDSVEIEGGYCYTCQEKIRTGLHGESLCPAQLELCPRHSS